MATVTKKVRTVKLVGRILTLTDAGKETSFFLTEIPSQLGGRGWRLEKFAIDCRGQGDEVYHVHLGGEQDTCECRGHLQHGHKTVCRHRAALQALLARGRLEDLDTVTCCWCKGRGREVSGRGCGHCEATGRQQSL